MLGSVMLGGKTEKNIGGRQLCNLLRDELYRAVLRETVEAVREELTWGSEWNQRGLAGGWSE